VFSNPVADFFNNLAHGKSRQHGADAQPADLSEEKKGQNCGDKQADDIFFLFLWYPRIVGASPILTLPGKKSKLLVNNSIGLFYHLLQRKDFALLIACGKICDDVLYLEQQI
jgi:hypothetical protein